MTTYVFGISAIVFIIVAFVATVIRSEILEARSRPTLHRLEPSEKLVASIARLKAQIASIPPPRFASSHAVSLAGQAVWCSKNLQDSWELDEDGFHFTNDDDAILFKMKWEGAE